VDVLVRPPWRFLRDYLLYSGWRDGRAGFIVATVSAFSVFCKYASLLVGDSPAQQGQNPTTLKVADPSPATDPVMV